MDRSGSSLEEGEIEGIAQDSEHTDNFKTGSEQVGLRKHGRLAIFFVSNIPDGCSRDSLKKIFEKHGEVFDIFVAKKKDKSGRNFGFVKYKNVQDCFAMETNLKNILVDNNRLVVYQARFDRFGNKIEPSTIQNSSMPEGAWKPELTTSLHKAHNCGGSNLSYRSALLNVAPSSMKSIVLSPDTFAFPDRHNGSLVGRVVDFNALRNIHSLFSKNDANVLGIRYLGGISLLLTFADASDAGKFLNSNEIWSNWFSSLDRWVGQSLPYERIAWIRVFGVPAHLWDRAVIDSIGNQVGRVIQGSQISWENCNWSQECIGVLVGDGNQIREEFNLKWRDKSYRVWLVEEPSEWMPDCLDKIPSSRLPPISSSGRSVSKASPGKNPCAVHGVAGNHTTSGVPRFPSVSDGEKTVGNPSFSVEVSMSGNLESPHQFSAHKDSCNIINEGPSKLKRFRAKSGSPCNNNQAQSFNFFFGPNSRKRVRVDNDPFGLDDILGLSSPTVSSSPDLIIPDLNFAKPVDPLIMPNSSAPTYVTEPPVETSKLLNVSSSPIITDGLEVPNHLGEYVNSSNQGSNQSDRLLRKKEIGLKHTSSKVGAVSNPPPCQPKFMFPPIYPP